MKSSPTAPNEIVTAFAVERDGFAEVVEDRVAFRDSVGRQPPQSTRCLHARLAMCHPIVQESRHGPVGEDPFRNVALRFLW